MEVAFEIFEGGTGLGSDLGTDAFAFALGEGAAMVGAGFRFERFAGLMESFDGADSSGTDAEGFGNGTGGVALLGECDDAVTKRNGKCLHGVNPPWSTHRIAESNRSAKDGK
jgi:hypothetical protein